MKKESISKFELQELSNAEIQDTNGGLFWLIPVIVGAAAVEIMSDWDNFKRGLAGVPGVPKQE